MCIITTKIINVKADMAMGTVFLGFNDLGRSVTLLSFHKHFIYNYVHIVQK